MKIKGKGSYICFLIFVLSLALLGLSRASERFSKAINESICQKIRGVLASINSVFSFSIFEILVLLSPVLIFIAVRFVLSNNEKMKARFVSALGFISLFASLYILTLGISYDYPSPFLRYSGAVDGDKLCRAANILCDIVNEESKSASENPSFDFISQEVNEVYKKNSSAYFRKATRLPSPKPLISSRLVNYTGILALYSYPTGEININTAVPTYTLGFTIAHEYAHAVGFSSESDASFLAFVLAFESDFPTFRDSVFLSVLDNMLSDIKSFSKEEYYAVVSRLCERAKLDITSYRTYLKKYGPSYIYKAFDTLNSEHLDVWDKNKRHSYLAVSRYVTNYLNSA